MKNMVFFHYDYGSRSNKSVTNLLGTYHGHLQSDGYKSYNVFNKNDAVIQVACMAHIRRKFEASLKENQAIAEFALSQIQLLYRLWMEKTYPTVLPKSLTGKAIGYAYSL